MAPSQNGRLLTKYANRKAKMMWDLAWFERYVMGKKELK